jgi:hypothetical protein
MTMPDEILPDQKVFLAHLRSGSFQSGLDRGWWRLVSVDWPVAMIGVSAAPRKKSPSEYILRFDCANYPQAAPTAQPWDLDHNITLDPAKWPGGQNHLVDVFRIGWSVNGIICLYIPCDRLSFQGHNDWPVKYPQLTWKNDSDITLYLCTIYDLLHSKDYTGVRGPLS